MNDVMIDGGAFGGAEGIDGTHIAQNAVADMVEVVIIDAVAFGRAVVVAPSPADRDGGIVQVCDFIVRDDIVGTVADPDAHGTGEQIAHRMQDVVIHEDMAGLVGEIGGDSR